MSINKHTPKSKLLILLLILSLIMSNFIQTPITALAADEDVKITVDSVSANFKTSGSQFKGHKFKINHNLILRIAQAQSEQVKQRSEAERNAVRAVEPVQAIPERSDF